MWDTRYGEPGFAYGTEPNDFLYDYAKHLPKELGPILSLAEGEGRNAVFLAQQGYTVHAVDSSAVGLEKATALAEERGVTIHTAVGDLAAWDLGAARWGGIVSIFCHLPGEMRKDLHRRVIAALKPGGVFLLEAYSLKQPEFGTGGPPAAMSDRLVSIARLQEELDGLAFVRLEAVEREIQEGRYHRGMSAVVQVIARKS